MTGSHTRFSMTDPTAEAKRLRLVDLAAAVIAAAVFCYLFYAASAGMGSIDEDMYYSLVYRWLAGDRPLIDEWHVSQLSSMLQIVPYWLYTALTGSTEGVILFLRYVYVAVDLIMYWYIYGKLRRYGVWGLLSAALFCTYIPSAILMLNYYTMTLHGLTVICFIFFFGKEHKSAPVLLLAGIVLACTVLAEPFLAMLYFFWSLLVLVKALQQKKGKPFLDFYAAALDKRTWLLTTIGVALTAAVFFAFLFSRSPLRDMIKEIPELFTDYEYSVQGKKSGNVIDFGKYYDALHFYGFFPVVSFLLSIPCVILRRLKKLDRYRLLLFIAACVCFIGSYAVAVYQMLRNPMLIGVRFYMPSIIFYYYFQGLPMLLFGLNCYLLCERRDRRVFGFWIVGFVSSLLIDLASELMFGTCAAVTFPAMLISLKTVAEELRESHLTRPKKKKPAKRLSVHKLATATVAPALCLCFLIGWEGVGVYTYGFYQVVEDIANGREANAEPATLQRGPLKGIRTTARLNGIYDDLLSDLDIIKTKTTDPVYVAALFPYFYIYMGLPVGTYTAWYVEQDSEVRQTRYWELHPERRPSYIYVPFYNDPFRYNLYWEEPGQESWGDEKLAFLKTVCDYTAAEGKAGLILRVDRWKI